MPDSRRVGFTVAKFAQLCAECGEKLSSGDAAGFDNETGDWLCSSHAVELAQNIGQTLPKFLQKKSSPAQEQEERSGSRDTKPGAEKRIASLDAQRQLKQIEAEALDHISDHLDAFERAIGERFQKLEQELSRKADLAASEITMAELRLSNAVKAAMDAHIGQMMKRVEEQVSGYVMALGTLEFRLKEHVATIESIRDKAPAPVFPMLSMEVEP